MHQIIEKRMKQKFWFTITIALGWLLITLYWLFFHPQSGFAERITIRPNGIGSGISFPSTGFDLNGILTLRPTKLPPLPGPPPPPDEGDIEMGTGTKARIWFTLDGNLMIQMTIGGEVRTKKWIGWGDLK